MIAPLLPGTISNDFIIIAYKRLIGIVFLRYHSRRFASVCSLLHDTPPKFGISQSKVHMVIYEWNDFDDKKTASTLRLRSIDAVQAVKKVHSDSFDSLK